MGDINYYRDNKPISRESFFNPPKAYDFPLWLVIIFMLQVLLLIFVLL